MMDRRKFLASGTLLALGPMPLPAEAQQAATVARIGYLGNLLFANPQRAGALP